MKLYSGNLEHLLAETDRNQLDLLTHFESDGKHFFKFSNQNNKEIIEADAAQIFVENDELYFKESDFCIANISGEQLVTKNQVDGFIVADDKIFYRGFNEPADQISINEYNLKTHQERTLVNKNSQQQIYSHFHARKNELLYTESDKVSAIWVNKATILDLNTNKKKVIGIKSGNKGELSIGPCFITRDGKYILTEYNTKTNECSIYEYNGIDEPVFQNKIEGNIKNIFYYNNKLAITNTLRLKEAIFALNNAYKFHDIITAVRGTIRSAHQIGEDIWRHYLQ